MSSRCLDPLLRWALAAALVALSLTGADARELRVCADPNNLPYSDEREAGFENRIAQRVAADLGMSLGYYWLPQWRGFTRKTLLEGHCDVIPGVPTGVSNVLVTDPYYVGAYALAFRGERVPGLSGLDDPRLRTLRIGLPLVGLDAIPAPPGRALARRGIFDNVVGFPVIGPHPVAERMIEALASGDIDVAIVWSPQAGYFGRRQRVRLTILPLESTARDPSHEFAIAMGVRPGDVALQRALNASLARLRPQIDAILRDYAVVAPGGPLAQEMLR
jgi:mxaJ protein